MLSILLTLQLGAILNMSRFFKRKKSVKEEAKTAEEEPVEEVQVEVPESSVKETVEAPEPSAEETTEAPEVTVTEKAPVSRQPTIPYHASIQDRLMYMFNDSTIGSGIEGTDEFYIEFMAMGERFWIGKAPLGKVSIKVGAMTDQDAHVRISNDVAAILLSAANFSEFSKVFMHYYKTPEPGKFIKIEVRKPITDLNRRGYARVPIMKLLIGSAR
ncbi:MAG: hypothetical protein C4K48_08540 [Candidatus Thorarchaeota archaeon]|nr:MAG: hypothetical protein C4K48_08540 [Candidatus Thorarchaeota archaeon]